MKSAGRSVDDLVGEVVGRADEVVGRPDLLTRIRATFGPESEDKEVVESVTEMGEGLKVERVERVPGGAKGSLPALLIERTVLGTPRVPSLADRPFAGPLLRPKDQKR